MSPLRIVVALLIVTSILGGTHYYLWARLLRDPALPEPWNTIGKVGVVLLGTVLVGSIALRRAPRAVSSPIAWVAYTWLGLVFFLFFLFIVVVAVRGIAALGARLASSPPEDPARRVALARWLSALVGLGAVGLGGVGFANVMRAVAVKRVRIELAKLPASLSGYRIALISDVHIGPTIGREFLEDVVRRVNALAPDLIAVAGDLVDGRVADLGNLVVPLKELRARDGVFFVTGNHEYYSGVDEWLAFLPTLGLKVLKNERVAIGGEGGFDLAGVEDLSARGFEGHAADLPRALEGRDPSRALVLLAHQPKAILEAELLGVDLQLSGHTHGGQLFPWKYAVGLDQPYVVGLHQHGNAKLYVSCGTGYWGPPMRVGAPAEITDIELVRAVGEGSSPSSSRA
jgi:predicted MPP superfamily phosphohydrolase